MAGSILHRTLRTVGVTIAVTALVATGTAAPAVAAQPKGLDHFVCYTAAGIGFKTPNVLLQNQFAPKGFSAATGGVVSQCNPVVKTLPSGAVTPVGNPRAHLVCVGIKPATQQPSHTVDVANQFGKARLTTGDPFALCLPSWKNPNAPRFPTATQPPNLDHFTCYRAAYLPGTPPLTLPSFVKLQDQFGTVTAKLGSPQALCLPTAKTVNAATGPSKVTHPQAHLLCLSVFPDPPVKLPQTVFDKNQFGIGKVKVTRTATLCLPSFKTIVR
jgi:hypothetical protein